MPGLGAGVSAVNAGIHQTVERHGRGTRPHHRHDDPEDPARNFCGGEAALAKGQERPRQGKWQGKTECSNLIISSVRRRRFQIIGEGVLIHFTAIAG